MIPKSPKTRFSLSPHAEPHSKWTGTLAFEEATDAAMLQTQFNLPEHNSQHSGSFIDQMAANHHRMEGARLFLSILMTIGDKPKETPTPENDGLKY